MSLTQFMQALSVLPQIIESLKKMGESEKLNFVEQLGLEGEEKAAAYDIITCFQEEKTLTAGQQVMAQKLLEKALQMNNLDLATIFSLNRDE